MWTKAKVDEVEVHWHTKHEKIKKTILFSSTGSRSSQSVLIKRFLELRNNITLFIYNTNHTKRKTNGKQSFLTLKNYIFIITILRWKIAMKIFPDSFFCPAHLIFFQRSCCHFISLPAIERRPKSASVNWKQPLGICLRYCRYWLIGFHGKTSSINFQAGLYEELKFHSIRR